MTMTMRLYCCWMALFMASVSGRSVGSASSGQRVETVVMRTSNNWEVGMTLDANFGRKPSPFTEETMAEFQSAWNQFKEDGKWDQNGAFEMTCDLVQSQEDKMEAIGVEGSLKMSYMMFSGDAHMEFAKNNVDSALDVSMIVKAVAYGRKGQLQMSDTNKLRLKDTTAMDREAFMKEYGQYMIVGFEYGGEIMFQSTHSVRSKEDKLKVAGGLGISFSKAGFSVEGKVEGSYDSSDVSNSYNSKTDKLVKPNVPSDDVTDVLNALVLLSQGNPTTEDFQTITAKSQSFLAGKQDPIKAVVVPLDSINVVHSLFVDSPDFQDTVAFMEFLNEIFVEVEALKKQIITVEGGWKMYAPDDEPWKKIGDWDSKLKKFSKEMKTLNTRTELIDYAKIWNADPHDDWNADVMTAESFLDVTKRGLGRQFEDAIMKPYENMLKKKRTTAKPTSKPTSGPQPTSKPTSKPLTPLVNKGNNPKGPLTDCEGDCDTDNDCKGDLKCWQRDTWMSPIPPGCKGKPHAQSHDYCWNPDQFTKALVNKGGEPDLPLGQCEGDCDRDFDCSGGMRCYHRDDDGSLNIPPGCKGTTHGSGHDYCYGGEHGSISDLVQSSTSMTWREARDFCEKKGLVMVSIHDDYGAEVARRECQGAGCWIGAVRGVHGSSGKGVVWIDGSKSSYTHWVPGQPNGGTKAICVQFHKSTGLWVDSRCDTKYKDTRALCEDKGWDPAPLAPLYKQRIPGRQCTVGKNDNPLISVGTWTLGECMSKCNTAKDSKGRRCVAIDFKDGGKAISSKTKRPCGLAWGCTGSTGWKDGSIFLRFDSAAHTAPGLFDTDPFDIDNMPDAEEPMKGHWTDSFYDGVADGVDPTDGDWTEWYQLHYYDVVTWLLITLVVLCAVNLCVTVRQRQQAQYVAVKYFDTESERDVEAMPMVQ